MRKNQHFFSHCCWFGGVKCMGEKNTAFFQLLLLVWGGKVAVTVAGFGGKVHEKKSFLSVTIAGLGG